ncbi:beta-ketoacyl synthase N-terminal-like domain-containing protein [Kitasatospora sp. NPDC054939]
MTGPRPQIALTGLGLVTAYGAGVDPYWRGLLSGCSALRPAERFASATWYQGEPVGEVPMAGGGPDAPGPDGGTRKQHLLETALAEALAAAGLPGLPAGALVVLVGQAPAVGAGAPPEAAELVGPRLRAAEGVPLFGGAPFYLSHACASAAFGLALAREALLAGAVRTAVVLGASALNPLEYASMKVVRVVSPRAARPFDRAGAGITIGEGAGAVVLEDRRSARERGRRGGLLLGSAVCRVAGNSPAASDDAVVADCVRQACEEGGVDRLDYVHAHATGTAQGDAAELRVLDGLADGLGQKELPVGSHKGAVGHLLHASCFPAVAAAALALRHGIAPPTPGLTDPAPAERLRLPTAALAVPGARRALLTSFGFGGNNAALTLHRAQDGTA